MKKRILFFIVLGMAFSQTNAQWDIDGKRGSKWFFSNDGRLNILDFTGANSTQLPVMDSSIFQNMNVAGNRAFISDTSGNLLFYSNGSILYDKTFHPMLNGDSITPNYFNAYLCYADGVVILPMPNHDSLYYVFTVTSNKPCVITAVMQIYYSIVNMKLNSGKGAVISKANLLFSGDSLASAHLKPVRHGNGKDWWLLIKDYAHNKFYRFLVDSSGTHSFTPQTIGSTFLMGNAWQAAFSPKGDKYAIMSGDGPYNHGVMTLNIYDFDRCSGLLSNPIQYPQFRVDTVITYYGICFSPNGKLLYWCKKDSIYQYDLLTNIAVNVAVYDTTLVPAFWDSLGYTNHFGFFYMQLGPDSRIYIGTAVNHLHYIDKPDLPGTACDVHQIAIPCPSYSSFLLFSNPFYSMPPIGDGCDSASSIGVNTFTFERNKILVYPNPSNGEYNVEVDKGWVTIEVYDMLGSVVYKRDNCNKQSTFNIHNKANGLYLVKVKKEGKEYASQKILKE